MAMAMAMAKLEFARSFVLKMPPKGLLRGWFPCPVASPARGDAPTLVGVDLPFLPDPAPMLRPRLPGQPKPRLPLDEKSLLATNLAEEIGRRRQKLCKIANAEWNAWADDAMARIGKRQGVVRYWVESDSEEEGGWGIEVQGAQEGDLDAIRTLNALRH